MCLEFFLLCLEFVIILKSTHSNYFGKIYFLLLSLSLSSSYETPITQMLNYFILPNMSLKLFSLFWVFFSLSGKVYIIFFIKSYFPILMIFSSVDFILLLNPSIDFLNLIYFLVIFNLMLLKYIFQFYGKLFHLSIYSVEHINQSYFKVYAP